MSSEFDFILLPIWLLGQYPITTLSIAFLIWLIWFLATREWHTLDLEGTQLRTYDDTDSPILFLVNSSDDNPSDFNYDGATGIVTCKRDGKYDFKISVNLIADNPASFAGVVTMTVLDNTVAVDTITHTFSTLNEEFSFVSQMTRYLLNGESLQVVVHTDAALFTVSTDSGFWQGSRS